MSNLDKIEELQQLVKEDSANSQARRQLAVLLLDSGFNEEALQHLLYLSKNFSYDDGIFYNLGIVYEKMKNFHKAKEAYLKSIDLNEEAYDAIYNLGLVYIELGEYENSISAFNQILQVDEDDSNTYFNIGLAYFKQGKFVEAMDNFQKTIDLNDEDLYAHFYIGNIYKEFGDLESAREEFNKVLELSPDYSWAYYNLAVIDYEQNDIESAIDNLNKTIEMNPSDIEAYKILAKILTSKGYSHNACEVIQTALSNCEESGDLYYVAAQVFKNADDMNSYGIYLNEAARNSQTLSISINTLKKELNALGQ